MNAAPELPGPRVITEAGLDALIKALAAAGHRVVGPRLQDDAIVYDDIAGTADLPRGWTDVQDAGRYRVARRDDAALFGYAVGAHAWRRFLQAPRQKLWEARKTEAGLQITPTPAEAPRYAFIAVRGCELHAIAIQDRVFMQGPYADVHYAAARRGAFTVALNCGLAGGTCFCVSMQTGPAVDKGYDLALTELLDSTRHDFLLEIGSPAGAAAIAGIDQRPAGEADIALARAILARTAGQMGRQMETAGLQQLLQANPTSPRWDAVASRCLACGNCTMVCPTCFCTSVEDRTALDAPVAERVKRWDSCFTLDHSYIHGGSVRTGTAAQYRQWMTHKLAHWIDQFGTSGCVGCGRCITWCPTGIDITAEAAALRAEIGKGKDRQHGDA